MRLLLPSSIGSAVLSAIVAVGLAILAVVVVKVVIRPLLGMWLSPSVDSSAVLFHLAAGEAIGSSMPARRQWGWGWQSGTLVVTDRRVWFFPAAWDCEPWAVSRSEIIRGETVTPLLTELLPLRNWPEPLRLETRDGAQSTFALADPASVLAYLKPAHHAEPVVITTRNLGRGVVDV
jgi:hypothetical protein